MSTIDCIFCSIISGAIPATIIKETDDIIVLKDINPKAPIHYLIIPKKHIKDVSSLTQGDAELLGKLFLMAKELGDQLSDDATFRLIANNGTDAGQSIFHVHIHFLSGKKMRDF